MAPSTTLTTSEALAEQLVPLVVQPLMEQSIVLSLGPRVFTSDGGTPVRVPKLADFTILGFPSAYQGASPIVGAWKGEGDQIDEDTPSWGEVTLLARDLKSLKILWRASNELLRHAGANVAQVVRDALVQRMQLELDRAFLRGNGVDNTPVGILEFTGTQTDTATWEAETVHEMVGAALAVNARPTGFVMNPAAFIRARQWRDDSGASPGTGQFLVQPDPQEGNVFRLAGYPVAVSTLMPEDRVLLGDWSQIAVARDNAMSVVIDGSRYLDTDETAIRLTSRWDIAPLNASAIVDYTIS
jgi:HK97 family phage major capsid protein